MHEKGFVVGDCIKVNGVEYIIKFTQSGMANDEKHMELILKCISEKTLEEMNETANQ